LVRAFQNETIGTGIIVQAAKEKHLEARPRIISDNGPEFIAIGIHAIEIVADKITRLGRDVAVKISAEQFSERFEPEPVPVEAPKGPNRSGGSQDSDWRCTNPECRQYNSIQRRVCAKCNTVSPRNGRRTRKALRERAAEHRIAAILGKHGI